MAALAILVGAPLPSRSLLVRLVNLMSWSVAVAFVTGVVLVVMSTDHHLHEHLWLRLVGIFTILLGVLCGSSHRILGKAADPVVPETLAGLKIRFWLMTATTIVVIILISAKPN